MRTLILTALLGSVALPAAAVAGPNDLPRPRHERSASASDDSSERPRAQRSASSEDRRAEPAVRQRSVSSASDGQSRRYGGNLSALSRHQREAGTSSAGTVTQETTTAQPRSHGAYIDGLRDARRRRDSEGGTTTTPTTNGGVTTAHRDRDRDRQWSSHWRNDRRYDWSRWRDRNRSLFRLGIYYDPYGYRYRRFSIGWNMWPSYYQSNYWLDDPWMYRLPPTYGPYRWVRYWDDALLVNIYTGEVVDVIYSFFW